MGLLPKHRKDPKYLKRPKRDRNAQKRDRKGASNLSKMRAKSAYRRLFNLNF